MTAQSAFIAELARIDNAIAELQKKRADFFNAHPDNLDWGDVGDMTRCASLIEEAANSVSHR